MFQVKVTKGDYNHLAESGTRTGQVVGCFASKDEAESLMKDFAEIGVKCAVSAYKLTPDEVKRAKLMSSFGQVYAPKHVEPAGKWVKV